MHWQERERQLLLKESQYIREFNLFERIIDNHVWFCVLYGFLMLVSLGLGILIGLLL